MVKLSDLYEREQDDRIVVAAFPVEDKSKTLEEIFPASWIDMEAAEPVVIPLLLAPPEVVKDLCKHMFDAGEEFLRKFFEERTPDVSEYATEGH